MYTLYCVAYCVVYCVVCVYIMCVYMVTALCSNLVGQLAVGLMTRPPKQGDPSFEVYQQERDVILAGMKHRASLLREGLNKLEGVSCADIQGAMYAFPTITLPGE